MGRIRTVYAEEFLPKTATYGTERRENFSYPEGDRTEELVLCGLPSHPDPPEVARGGKDREGVVPDRRVASGVHQPFRD